MGSGTTSCAGAGQQHTFVSGMTMILQNYGLRDLRFVAVQVDRTVSASSISMILQEHRLGHYKLCLCSPEAPFLVSGMTMISQNSGAFNCGGAGQPHLLCIQHNYDIARTWAQAPQVVLVQPRSAVFCLWHDHDIAMLWTQGPSICGGAG